MVRAALSGALDFSEGDPRDALWVGKLHLIAGAIEAADIRRINELAYLRDLTALSRVDIAGDDYAQISDAAAAKFRDILRAYFPWVPIDDKSSVQQAMQAMGGSWEVQYGKLEDQDTQARIAATVKEMLERPIRAAQERAKKRQPAQSQRSAKGKARRRNARLQ